MARKKVNLAYITNDVLRHITFKKRCSSMIKKVSELSTLYGVPACIVIYGPHEAKPKVWPSGLEAQRILQHFQELPELEQSKKNQEGFLQQWLRKHVEQLQKQEREIHELEMVVLMYEMMDDNGLHNMRVEDAISLVYLIDMRLKVLYEVAENAKATAGGA